MGHILKNMDVGLVMVRVGVVLGSGMTGDKCLSSCSTVVHCLRLLEVMTSYYFDYFGLGSEYKKHYSKISPYVIIGNDFLIVVVIRVVASIFDSRFDGRCYNLQ